MIEATNRSAVDASGRTRGRHTSAPHEATPGWKVNGAGLTGARRSSQGAAFATREDITRLFGELSAQDVLKILMLAPTIAELEEAHMWREGQADVVARRGHPESIKVLSILEIIGEDDDLEEPHYLR